MQAQAGPRRSTSEKRPILKLNRKTLLICHTFVSASSKFIALIFCAHKKRKKKIQERSRNKHSDHSDEETIALVIWRALYRNSCAQPGVAIALALYVVHSIGISNWFLAYRAADWVQMSQTKMLYKFRDIFDYWKREFSIEFMTRMALELKQAINCDE